METGNRLAVGYNSASRLEDQEEPNSMPDEAVECAPRSEVTMESLMGGEGEKQSTTGMEAKDLSSLDKTRTRLEATQWESLSAQLEEKEILITTRPQMDPSIGQQIPLSPLCHQKSKLHKKSFIDDLTLLKKISLSNLIEKKRIIGPLNYHDRFNLTLPQQKSILQH